MIKVDSVDASEHGTAFYLVLHFLLTGIYWKNFYQKGITIVC